MTCNKNVSKIEKEITTMKLEKKMLAKLRCLAYSGTPVSEIIERILIILDQNEDLRLKLLHWNENDKQKRL